MNYFVIVYHNKNGQIINALKFYHKYIFLSRHDEFFCYTKDIMAICIMPSKMTFYPLFCQKYLNAYQISVESAKPPKNGRRNQNSPKYPLKIDEKRVVESLHLFSGKIIGTKSKFC